MASVNEEVSIRVQGGHVNSFMRTLGESVTTMYPALNLTIRRDCSLDPTIELSHALDMRVRHVPRLDVGADSTIIFKLL